MATAKKKVESANRIPLDQCHLAGLRSTHALAKRLGWPLKKLESLSVNGGYRVYPHPQTGRTIEEPGRALQSLHRSLHRYLSRVEVPDYLHSAVKGRSYLTNAKAHVGPGALVKVDIAKFYRAVPQHRIMHFFRDDLRCAGDVAGLLASLICYDGHLATGSSVSPIISFLAFRGMFDELHELAEAYDLRMTCYVDDVAMSGPAASMQVLHKARGIVAKAGFDAHKERFYPQTAPKVVTGLVVNERQVDLPFQRWRKIHSTRRELAVCDVPNDRDKLFRSLVSRLYEATQIDSKCRAMAVRYHHEWRRENAKLKSSASGGTARAA